VTTKLKRPVDDQGEPMPTQEDTDKHVKKAYILLQNKL